MWRQRLDFDTLGYGFEGFEIFQSVASKKSGIFCHFVFDHLPSYRWDDHFPFGKRKEGGFINLVFYPVFAIYGYPLWLYVGDVEVFFPSIGRLDLL